MKKLILLICFIFTCSVCDAATYYVDGSAANDTGTGQSGSPKKYIESGIALLSSSGGDTLTIADGTYSTSSDQITGIPNGQAGLYNVVKATNDGGVVITAADGFSVSSEYVQIEGLKLVNASEKLITGNHLKILRCAFSGSGTGNNDVTTTITGSYNLLEDCWVYGTGGRYKVLVYNAHHNILRRVLARDDGGWTSDDDNPEAVFCVYNSANNLLQNCIAIDSDLLTYDDNFTGGFYQTGHDDANLDNIDNLYQGCISLNVNNGNFVNDDDSTGTGTSLVDCVGYGGNWGYVTSNSAEPVSLTGCTFGNISEHGVACYASGGGITITNSIIWDVVGDALRSSTCTVTGTYCDTYGTANNGSGTGVIHINPLTNGLLYLLRIEALSTLLTAGDSGGQMGAEILKKYGSDGTLYGEAGYNTLSANDLWPFPYESRLKTDLSAVSTRGFCASGTRLDGVNPVTLTSYIWEYLGNEIPEDIYGESPVYDAPIVEILTESQTTTAETITIIGTLTTDSALTGSGVDVNGVTATADDGTWDEAVENWTALGVTLSLGANTITATGTDSEAETDADTVSITRTAPVKTTKINGSATLKNAVIHQ